MIARALNDVDRDIVETREHIEVQRDVVRKFTDGGQIADAALTEGILRALEKSLSILHERRRTVLSEARQPRASFHKQRRRVHSA